MAKRRNERSLSIGTKMLLSHLLLCVVIIVLGALLSMFLTIRYIRESRMKDLLVKAERIAESSRQMPKGEYVPDRHVLRTYAYLSDAQVFFLVADSGSICISRYRPPEKDAEPNNDTAGSQVPEDHPNFR